MQAQQVCAFFLGNTCFIRPPAQKYSKSYSFAVLFVIHHPVKKSIMSYKAKLTPHLRPRRSVLADRICNFFSPLCSSHTGQVCCCCCCCCCCCSCRQRLGRRYHSMLLSFCNGVPSSAVQTLALWLLLFMALLQLQRRRCKVEQTASGRVEARSKPGSVVRHRKAPTRMYGRNACVPRMRAYLPVGLPAGPGCPSACQPGCLARAPRAVKDVCLSNYHLRKK